MDTFITGFLLSLSLCLDIGIGNVAIIEVTLKYGVRPAYWFASGSVMGDLIYAGFSLVGMGLLLQFRAVQWITWIGGGAMLSWLALKMALAAWRDVHQVNNVQQDPLPPRLHLFGRGIRIALASPSSLLWFAAIGGSLIAQATDGSAASTMKFLAGFLSGGLAWCYFLITVTMQGGKLLGRRFIQGCHLMSAVLYVYFAVMVLVKGAHNLL